MPRLLIAVLAFAASAFVPAAAFAQVTADPPPPPAMPGAFEEVGHEPLMMRGMNAALAVYGGYAYVGSRTDGSHANSGVMVVDVRDPAAPKIVKEIGPTEGEGLPTQTSGREMRILPDQKLLIVANHQCNEAIHRCVAPSNAGVSALPSNFKIFDIAGENAANPKLVCTYEPSHNEPQTPHEWFMWTDPKRPSRVLMYYTDPYGAPEITVADFSRVRECVVPEIAGFDVEADGGIHSMTLSNDGKRMFIAALTGGYVEADASEVAEGKADPKIKQITDSGDAPTWDGPGAHSAIGLPGRPGTVMVTDEVYGMIPGLLSNHGCPWGWVRFVSDATPAKPAVISEYKLPVNEKTYCDVVPPDRNSLASWSAHNPTLTEHLAVLSWHSAGLQAIDTTDPSHPTGAANWRPEPLLAVQTEDPVLSSGPDKVVVWSFPVIVNGLIYLTDIRNGLYILRYKGPHSEEISTTRFLDGNSNSGDVARLEPVAGAAASKPSAAPGVGPAVGGPAPCLLTPLRFRGTAVGPFRIGDTRARVELRGGPPSQVRKTSLSYCVDGGGRVAVAFTGRRAGLIGVTSGRVSGTPRGLVPGAAAKLPRKARKLGGGLVMVRGKKSSVVARVRGGKVTFAGVALGRPTAKSLAKLARAAGI
jgi:hypothetical protein